MEVLCALGAGVMTGAALLVLTGGPDLVRPLTAGRAVRVALAASRWLGRAGRSRAVAALLARRDVRALAREVASGASERGLELGEGAAAAALLVAALAASVVVGLLMGSPVAGAAAAAALAGAALLRERSRRSRLRGEVLASMPGVYRTLSVALGSGQTLSQAVSYVGVHERGPAAEAFGRMSLRLRCGMGTEEAVGLLARELDAPGAGLLATALVISHRTGSPLRDLLMRSAALAERQGEFERLLGVKTAQVRLSVKIVCLLPAVMLCLLALISPDFQAGLLTPVGLGCVSAAAALDGLALALIRRMVREVL